MKKNIFVDSDGKLKLVTKNFERKSGQLYIVGMPIVFLIICYLFFRYTRINWHPDFLGISILILFSTYIGISYFNVVIKILKNNVNFVFSKESGHIVVNDSILCKSDDLISIIIQPSTGTNGLLTSNTVGLEIKGKSIPISFFHGEGEAKRIANTIAEFYQKQVFVKKPYLFSFFRKF